jgi:hypothetical protein
MSAKSDGSFPTARNIRFDEEFAEEVHRACSLRLTPDQRRDLLYASNRAVITFRREATRTSPTHIVNLVRDLKSPLERLLLSWSGSLTEDRDYDEVLDFVDDFLEERAQASAEDPFTILLSGQLREALVMYHEALCTAEERWLPQSKTGRRPDRYLNELILALAELYERWGGRASAAHQKTKNLRDTPFTRFVILVCQRLRKDLPKVDADGNALLLAELEPGALRSRLARLLKARRGSKDQKTR